MKVQVTDVGFGYSPYPHELSRDPRVSLPAKGLFAVYGSFTSVTDPTAWPSEQYLCKLCGGIHAETFRKYKRELLAAGWIGQAQRHRENGQYTTLLVTRYYHPSMNPDFAIKSTDEEKTGVGKTGTGKIVPQEQEPKGTKKEKNTRTKRTIGARVCGSIGKEKDLTKEQQDCIEWTIAEQQRRGTLKNPGGYRAKLVQSALDGRLDVSGYRAKEGAKEGSRKTLQQVEEWEQAAKADPITKEFLEEQRKRYPNLFRKGAN